MSLEKADVGSDISEETDVGCRLPSPLRGEPDADICLDAGDRTAPTKPEEQGPALPDPTPLSPAARAAARILERRRAVQTSPPTQPKEDPMPKGMYDRSKAKPRGSAAVKPTRPTVAQASSGDLSSLVARFKQERDDLDNLIAALERIAAGRT